MLYDRGVIVHLLRIRPHPRCCQMFAPFAYHSAELANSLILSSTIEASYLKV